MLRLVAQLFGLERRTARGGRDIIDHAPGGHDDVANAAAGALVACATRVLPPLEFFTGSAPDGRSVDEIQEAHDQELAERVAASHEYILAKIKLNGVFFPGD